MPLHGLKCCLSPVVALCRQTCHAKDLKALGRYSHRSSSVGSGLSVDKASLSLLSNIRPASLPWSRANLKGGGPSNYLIV